VRLNPPIQIPADPYSCERKAVCLSISSIVFMTTSICANRTIIESMIPYMDP